MLCSNGEKGSNECAAQYSATITLAVNETYSKRAKLVHRGDLGGGRGEKVLMPIIMS